MSKYIRLFAIMFMLGLTACTRVENNNDYPIGERVNVIVVASQDDSQTKTHIGEHYSTSGYSVLWDEEGESIMLMEKVTQNGEISVQKVVSEDYTLSEDAKIASFMGLTLAVNEASEGSVFDYVVISPSSAVNMDTENHSIVGLALPAVQKPKVDSYDPNASILVGSSLGNGEQKDVVEADLTHILAYAKMTVKNVPTDDKIETVEFITEKDIYGTVLKYNIEDGTVGSDSSLLSVKIDVSSIPHSGESFDVYFTALPTEFSSGDKFSVKVSTFDKTYIKEWTMTDTKKFDLISQSVLTFSVDMEDAEVGEVEWPVPDNEIWYTTKDNSLFSDWTYYKTVCGEPFDKEIVSHTYTNGIGRIVFNEPITRVNDNAFSSYGNYTDRPKSLTNIYLPNKIEYIGSGAFGNQENIETFKVPNSKFELGGSAFQGAKVMKFIGENILPNGEGILVDGILYALNYDDKTEELIIPEGVIEIGEALTSGNLQDFCNRPKVKRLVISEGVRKINNNAFWYCTSLESVSLPSTLEEVGSYIFRFCPNIGEFIGSSKFITADNKCFLDIIYVDGQIRYGIQSVAKIGLPNDYVIPEGIVTIRPCAFEGIENLHSITLPNSIMLIESSGEIFRDCPDFEFIYGRYASNDNKAAIINNCLFCGNTNAMLAFAGKGIKKYTISDEVNWLGDQLFSYQNDLEELVISDKVYYIGNYCFAYSPNLKSITLPANLEVFRYDPFIGSNNLETIYFRSPLPPKFEVGGIEQSQYTNLTIYVPEQYLQAYLNDASWSPLHKYMKGYQCDDLYYISSDYSKDGVVSTLQTASKGDGIDIVLMGDAYSDRQIADGTYEADMENLYNNLFTEEPYKSFKDHFNVYYVNVVSATEGYEYGHTALDGYFGSGTLAGGNDNAVFNYALKAISAEEMDEALLIVAMNSDAYAGTCFMYYPTETDGTYGSGPSVSYFPKGGDAETFASLLHHEACGHGFAKLGDEYAYEDYGEAPADYIAQTKQHQDSWGWWKNVDFTDDPSAVRWNYFLSDERYANDGLGVFEGGLTYWSGVWRPTENSIMRYNTGGFNAPSREAIYYRIHKLAYGADWEYDYEDFVEYDSVNRKSASEAAAVSATKYVYQPKPQLHAPVVINKTWRDAE